MDIEQLQSDSQRVSALLANSKLRIFPEHKTQLTEWKTLVDKYLAIPQVTNIHGRHFSTCWWSNDNCGAGPDTCDCVGLHFQRRWTIDLIQYYEQVVLEEEASTIKMFFQSRLRRWLSLIKK